MSILLEVSIIKSVNNMDNTTSISTEILGNSQFESLQLFLNNEVDKILIITGYHNSGKKTLLNQIPNKIILCESTPKRYINRMIHV